MKVRIKVQPTGYVSIDGGPLSAWPKVGAVVELPDAIAEDLINSGRAEKVRVGKAEPISEQAETRPAQTASEEQRSRTPRQAARKDN